MHTEALSAKETQHRTRCHTPAQKNHALQEQTNRHIEPFLWVSDTCMCLWEYCDSVREPVWCTVAQQWSVCVWWWWWCWWLSPLHHPGLGKVELGKKCGMSGPRHEALRLHWIIFFFSSYDVENVWPYADTHMGLIQEMQMWVWKQLERATLERWRSNVRYSRSRPVLLLKRPPADKLHCHF